MTTHTTTAAPELSFLLSRTAFDADYIPCQTTRATTNFANLARGERRKQNLQNTLRMMENRFNALAHWDNASADRYGLQIEIISVALRIGETSDLAALPLIEFLDTTIIDRKQDRRLPGMTGNSFSSYLRDYDFSLLLPQYMAQHPAAAPPEDFGDLHGKLFKHFLRSETYQQNFPKQPVICLSASTSRSYRRTGNQHPVLGHEYVQDALSRTDLYFAKMGCTVRFFLPEGSVAPLAFYANGALLEDYTDLELISAIATMETFQRIYRPEIYNANARASALYRPSLEHQDFSLTQIVYDREERSRLAREQALFTQDHLVIPHQDSLAAWSAAFI